MEIDQKALQAYADDSKRVARLEKKMAELEEMTHPELSRIYEVLREIHDG